MADWVLKSLFGVAVGFVLREGSNAIRRRQENKASAEPRNALPNQYVPASIFLSYLYHAVTRNESEKELNNCLSFFREGIEMFQTSLNHIDPNYRAEDVFAYPNFDAFAANFDKLKSVSKESYDWAKSSFKRAREAATKAFNNEALSPEERLLASKVRILSAVFGGLEEPWIAAVACKLYLTEVNSLPCIADELSLHIQAINMSHYERKSKLLTLAAFTNYIVFQFTETQAKDVLNVNNWPKLKGPDTCFVHPIRSVGLPIIPEEFEGLASNIQPQSVSFNKPVNATDIVANSSGELIIIGLDSTAGPENNVLRVFSNSGQFRFAITPNEKELQGNLFKPRAVFTDESDDIYVYLNQTKRGEVAEENAKLLIFNKAGRFQSAVSIQRGFMALEKRTARIFISNKNGVHIYEKNGDLLRSFPLPQVLQGSACPIALGKENKIILTSIHQIHHSTIFILSDTGEEIHKFPVRRHASGWKYIVFNPVSDEILVSYLPKELTHFHLDSYLENGQLLGTIDLPQKYTCHPRAVKVTSSGRIAILYEDIVQLI